MTLRTLLCSAFAAAFVAGCQSAPEPAPLPVADQPDPAPVELPAPPDPEEPRVNEWGGEVPQAQPTGDVGEGGLGDIP
ncbi:MAG: hypothetical protein ACK4MQ_01570 [Hyphomonas sp.]